MVNSIIMVDIIMAVVVNNNFVDYIVVVDIIGVDIVVGDIGDIIEEDIVVVVVVNIIVLVFIIIKREDSIHKS